MTRVSRQPATGSRWLLPATCLVLGGCVLLADWLGGQLASGLIRLAIIALFVAAAGRSETVRSLRGDGRG